MARCNVLLAKCPDLDLADDILRAQVTELGRASPAEVKRATVHRAVDSPEIYAYFEFAHERNVGDDDLARFVETVRALAGFNSPALRVDRLTRQMEAAEWSAGAPAPFHYAVETDPAKGWENELTQWYDTEHLPGLARVPGCVRAQRFINGDGGPYSLACYDLTRHDITSTPAWLAVRATPWSSRVRPNFCNSKRTMFRSL